MNTIRLRNFFAVTLLMLAVSCFSAFEILDQKEYHALLRRIAPMLETRGIDVMQNWQSDAETKGRPVLAPLANYRWRDEKNIEKFNEGWVQEFANWIDSYDKGEVNFMLAVQDVSTNLFLQKWNRASPEKRIFISFSREDEPIANAVRTVLENENYTVFTFLNEGDNELSAQKIAYYMTTSGDRLVLDTENARLKSGVLAESLAEAKYRFAYSDNLAQKIKAAKAEILQPDFLKKEWKEASPKLTDEQVQLQIDEVRSKLLLQLEREQSSGRIQVEILANVFSAISICPYYGVPRAVCPICGPALLLLH